MTLDIYRSVLKACPVLMRPIIRILLRAGINYKQFAKITREVFVEVASDDYGLNGRKTNTSRVAILTGISRSEVTKIRKKYEESGEIEIPQTVNNAGRLLSGWHVDPTYLDKEGRPLNLAVHGKAPSFETLMHTYGGDIPLTAMLKELKQISAIEIDDTGMIKVLQRYFMPVNYDENRIFSLIESFVDLGETSYHNFVRNVDEDTRFDGRVFNNYVNKESIPAFKELLEDKGSELFTELDSWLTDHEINSKNPENNIPVRLGLGMYLIQDDNKGANLQQ